MTEANLRPWPPYQLHNMYHLHKSGEVCTQFQKKSSYAFGYTWCNLHWSQLNKVCAQFDVIPVVHLPLQRRMLGTGFIGQSSTGCARNLRKNNYALGQLCMYSKPYVKLAKGMLDSAYIGYEVQRGLYTILGKNSYTLTQLARTSLCFFTNCDYFAM